MREQKRLTDVYGDSLLYTDGRAFREETHVEQISPDKNVNCRYTTAAFTISPESMGLRHVVLTCPDDGLVCCFCSSAHSFALRLPPDPSSRLRAVALQRAGTETPLPSASTWFTLSSRQCWILRTGDLHPISSRPCRAYTKRNSSRDKAPMLCSPPLGKQNN